MLIQVAMTFKQRHWIALGRVPADLQAGAVSRADRTRYTPIDFDSIDLGADDFA